MKEEIEIYIFKQNSINLKKTGPPIIRILKILIIRSEF